MFSLFGGFFKISSINLFADFSIRNPLNGSFSLKGDLKLGSLEFSAGIACSLQQFSAFAIPKGGVININSLLSALGGKLFDSPDGISVALRSAGFGNFTLKNVLFEGFWSNLPNVTGADFRLRGIASIGKLPKLSLEVLVLKMGTPNCTVAYGFETPRIPLAKLLNDLVGLDISSIPVLGSLSLPSASLVFSNVSLPNFNVSTPAVNFPDLSQPSIPLPPRPPSFSPGGISVGFSLPSLQTLPVLKGFSLGIKLKVPSTGKLLPLNINLKNINLIDFKAVDLTQQISLNVILSTFFPTINLSLLQLPSIFPPILNIGVDFLQFDRLTHVFSISGAIPGLFPLVPKFLSLSNVVFHVEVNLTTKLFDLRVSGGLTLGSLRLNAFIQKIGPNMEIKASLTDPLKLTDLALSLGGSIVPPSVFAGMSAILDKLDILNASFHAVIGLTKSFSFYGVPKLPGIPKASIEVHVINFGTPNCKLLVGVELPSITVSKVVKAFLPSVQLDLPVISNLTIPAVTLFLANVSLNYSELLPSGIPPQFSCNPNTQTTLLECLPTAKIFKTPALNKLLPLSIAGHTLIVFTPLRVPGLSYPLNLTVSILPPNTVQLSARPLPSFTVRNIANAFLGTLGLDKYTFPKGFPNILNMRIDKLLYMGHIHTLELSVGISGKINVLPNLLYMDGATCAFVINTKNWTFDFEASGQVWLGNLGFDTNVTKLGNLHLGAAEPVGGDLRLKELANLFGGFVLPSGSIQAALKAAKLDDFTLKNVRLSVGWGPGSLSLHFFARPSGLPGIPTANVEILAIDVGKPSCVFAMGFTVSLWLILLPSSCFSLCLRFVLLKKELLLQY